MFRALKQVPKRNSVGTYAQKGVHNFKVSARRIGMILNILPARYVGT